MIFKFPGKKPIQKSDEELMMEFISSGDPEVLGELYSKYMHLVYGVCLKYLKEREESMDFAPRGAGLRRACHSGALIRNSCVKRRYPCGDHNFRSAYLHVLADALTSLLAIFALLAGKYLRQGWLDPFMGVIGAALVVRWSWTLLRSSARVLLDMQAPEELREGIRKAIESEGDHRISDLHVWSVGPGLHAAEIVVVSSQPLETTGYYDLLPKDLGIVHMTVETRQCASPAWKAT